MSDNAAAVIFLFILLQSLFQRQCRLNDVWELFECRWTEFVAEMMKSCRGYRLRRQAFITSTLAIVDIYPCCHGIALENRQKFLFSPGCHVLITADWS